jgi:hypothetical protein
MNTISQDRSQRFPVEINAEIVSENLRHEGIIENLSEKGVCLRITPTKTLRDFTPGIRLDLKFQLPTGKKLSLYCKKKWSYKITPRSLMKRIGVELIDPPSEYKDFLATLK